MNQIIAMCVSASDMDMAEAFWRESKRLGGHGLKGPDIPVVIFTDPGVSTHTLEVEHQRVIIQLTERGYPFVNRQAFSKMAEWCYHFGFDFINVEPDCIPLAKDWARKLFKEFDSRPEGKLIMAPAINNGPHDTASGIAVFHRESYSALLPILAGNDPHWDKLMYDNLDTLCKTDSIFHKYGEYHNAMAHPNFFIHGFPKEAVLAHKSWRGVSREKGPIQVGSEGDIGDVIYMMSSLAKSPSGPFDFICQSSTITKSRGETWRLRNPIARLLEAQPYINICRNESKYDDIRWRSGDFRKDGFYNRSRSLSRTHLAHLKAKGNGIVAPDDCDTEEPWLRVDPIDGLKDRVVINRTFRYNNAKFPWSDVVNLYGDRIVFIGSPMEHYQFCKSFGNVDYRSTLDMLDAAQVIAGSGLFIGNQSSCYAIAEGLKVNRILEVSPPQCDCIIKGSNVQHVFDGTVLLPDVGGSGERNITPPVDISGYSSSISPPGQWQFPGIQTSVSFNQICHRLASARKISMKEAEVQVMIHNIQRCPEWQSERDDYHQVRRSFKEAGI